MPEPLLLRYLQPLLAGRRAECFEVIRQALAAGQPAEDLLCDVLWPAMVQVDRLYRDDRISQAAENMAYRINRTVAEQVAQHLPVAPPGGRRVAVWCVDERREEAAAQMCADLLQSRGWEVYFLAGPVPYDEVLALTGELRPAALLVYGAGPDHAPEIRALVDRIREIGACPDMNVVVSGGVFNRADGLWQEVGADAFAAGVRELLDLLDRLPPRAPDAPRVSLVKQRRRRRRDHAQRAAGARATALRG